MIIISLLLAMRRKARMPSNPTVSPDIQLAEPVDEISTREIVGSFLREIDAASACVRQLHVALAERDRDQIVAIAFSLHAAWWRARQIIGALTLLKLHLETVARDSLQQSREFARGPLAQAWQLLQSPPPNRGAPGRGSQP